MEERTCNKCGEIKPISLMTKNSRNGNPRNYCKACDVIAARERQQRDPEHLSRKRKRYWRDRKKNLKYKKNYYKKNRNLILSKEKQRSKTKESDARHTLRAAVSAGKIHKPNICPSCNKKVLPNKCTDITIVTEIH